MSEIRRPDTQKEMVYQLWYIIIGSNGDGLATQIKNILERMGKIETCLPSLWTRAEHDAACEEFDRREAGAANRRKVSAREWVLVAVSLIGPIVAVVLAKII